MSFLLEGPLILFAPLFLDPHDGDARMGTLKFLSEQLTVFSSFLYEASGGTETQGKGNEYFPISFGVEVP